MEMINYAISSHYMRHYLFFHCTLSVTSLTTLTALVSEHVHMTLEKINYCVCQTKAGLIKCI